MMGVCGIVIKKREGNKVSCTHAQSKVTKKTKDIKFM